MNEVLRTFDGNDVPQKPTKKYENGVGVGNELIRIVIEDLYGVFNNFYVKIYREEVFFIKIDRKKSEF